MCTGGSLCSVRSGSVCARCLWVILCGYNKRLLRVNGGLLAALGDCDGRLWQTVAAAQALRARFEFPTLIVRRRTVGGPLESSRANAVKTREFQVKIGSNRGQNTLIEGRLHGPRHGQIPLPAVRRKSGQAPRPVRQQSTLPPRIGNHHGVVAARPNTKASSSRDADRHLRLAVAARHGHENRVSTMERAHVKRGEETLGLDAAHRDAAAGAR